MTSGPSDDRYAKGVQHLERTQGVKTAGRIHEALREVSPSYERYSIAATYGEVFGRPGLDVKSRQLATIAILATMGGCDPALRLHVNAGLEIGLEPDEIIETFVQVAVYAGAARASSAVLIAGEVFAKRGVSAS